MNETVKRLTYGVGVGAVIGAAALVAKVSPGLAVTAAPTALAALNALVRKWRGGEVSKNEVAMQALPGTALGGGAWYLLG